MSSSPMMSIHLPQRADLARIFYELHMGYSLTLGDERWRMALEEREVHAVLEALLNVAPDDEPPAGLLDAATRLQHTILYIRAANELERYREAMVREGEEISPLDLHLFDPARTASAVMLLGSVAQGRLNDFSRPPCRASLSFETAYRGYWCAGYAGFGHLFRTMGGRIIGTERWREFFERITPNAGATWLN